MNPNTSLTHSRRRPRLQWQDRALLLLAIILIGLFALRSATAQTEPWGLEFDDGTRSVALDTDMRVEIDGLAARVEVSQFFENLGDDWREATYRYPLPPGASVDRLVIESDGRLIEGEIREKAEATRRYQQARAAGAVASLVEQERPNQFQTSIANIAPGATVRVVVGFLVTVDYRDGEFRLDLPLTFTPRADSAVDWSDDQDSGPSPVQVSMDQNPVDDHYFSLDIDLRSGMHLARIESPWHDVDIHPSLNGYRVFLADPDRSDRDFALTWAPDFHDAPQASLATWDDGDAVYALLMLAPPLTEALDPRPREVVFVIDTSGSMQGASLEQAQQALREGLDHLGPDDRFNLVRFASDAQHLFPESVPVESGWLEHSETFIDSLQADGGTNMASALTLALSLPDQPNLLRQVVFITDGSIGNEHELLLQVGEQLRDARLFTVSIGSAPNTWFMRKAAEIGRGSHTRIGSAGDVPREMQRLWTRIENPAIQNLCVDWGMDAEFYPEIIPDLYAGEPLWLHARLPREPRQVTLCGELGGRFWETEVPLQASGGGANLATLWARSKIEALEDSRIFGVSAADIRVAVLNIALQHGLLTPHTSLVAVDRTPVRPDTASLNSEQVPGLLPAGSTAGAGFSPTGNGWLTRVALSLLSLLAATGMLLYVPPSRARSATGGNHPMVSG